MLNKTAMGIMLGAVLLTFALSSPGLCQGVLQQEYAGLDKYPTQGRPDGASFVGVRAAEFLTIPVGARGIGMGSSFSAVADDITSIWWNPAGLGFLESAETMVNVVDHSLDLTYTYGAVAVPMFDNRMTFGAFVGYLDVPEIEITTLNSPNGTGRTYNAYDLQMGGSFAYNFSDRFVGGINMKYVHQEMFSNISGNAFAIDAGAIYHTQLADKEIKFAFSIQNLGTNITMTGPNLLYEVGPNGPNDQLPTGYDDYSTNPEAVSRRSNRWMYYQTHTYRLPTVVKIAVSYNLYTSEKINWMTSGELWRNSNIPLSHSAGTELAYTFAPYTSAALRMGWKVQGDEYTQDRDGSGIEYLGEDPTFRGLSFGGGLRRNIAGHMFSFNYAYRNMGRLSADNFFTVTAGF